MVSVLDNGDPRTHRQDRQPPLKNLRSFLQLRSTNNRRENRNEITLEVVDASIAFKNDNNREFFG